MPDPSKHEAYVVLASLLRQMRVKAGMTQRELSERLGMPQSYVSKYETGERRLDLIELRAIAEATGVSLPALVRSFLREATG